MVNLGSVLGNFRPRFTAGISAKRRVRLRPGGHRRPGCCPCSAARTQHPDPPPPHPPAPLRIPAPSARTKHKPTQTQQLRPASRGFCFVVIGAGSRWSY